MLCYDMPCPKVGGITITKKLAPYDLHNYNIGIPTDVLIAWYQPFQYIQNLTQLSYLDVTGHNSDIIVYAEASANALPFQLGLRVYWCK